MSTHISLHSQLSEIPIDDWDNLGSADYPFTRHAFLSGLESNDCLLPFGWQPLYFCLYSDQQLLAAIPCYIKNNSYGELVFDHAWANAYQRSGLQYYPKLVTAIPYTPATGERFLINREITKPDHIVEMKIQLCRAIQNFCSEKGFSSWHLLFENESVIDSLSEENLLKRCDIQFHWENREYTDFDHFLSNLSSRKRKNIRKERSRTKQHNLDISMESASILTEGDWVRVYELYAGIYDRKHGTPTLTADFFQYLGHSMAEHTLVATARQNGVIQACSVFFRSATHLYGRVWGCDDFYRDLHFECCYYLGIEYCIENQLSTFDPGAQGEHKLSRGFLPTKTWSGHWFNHPEFQSAVSNFLDQERRHIDLYQKEMFEHSPYRS
ncbi:MAG: putative N-acyltransferase [Gammaproteobacteria bacterium]|jgi:predicted N-acyltransferase